MSKIRIMFWNIKELGLQNLIPGKFDPLCAERFAHTRGDPNRKREDHILDTIKDVDPDILLVLEVRSCAGQGGRGYAIAGKGRTEVLYLLWAMQRQNTQAAWRLVPPLWQGMNNMPEAVAVYFKSAKLDFAGPWVVANATNVNWQCSKAPFPRTVPTEWGGYWKDCLPTSEPVGRWFGRFQNELAAQWQYKNSSGATLKFPDNDDRAPYHTRFHVPNEARTGLERIISVFAFHAPSQRAPAALKALAQVAEIVGDRRRPSTLLDPNEVRVVGGDFNVNQRYPLDAQAYDDLLKKEILRDDRGTTEFKWAFPDWKETRIDATKLKDDLRFATPLNGTHPYYDFMSSYRPFGTPEYFRAYDGILYAYGTDPKDEPTGHAANRVAGEPLEIGSDMEKTIRWYQKEEKGGHPGPATTVFRNMENYGKIRGASDHFAVYADV